jgi:hypothetical protein
MRRRRRMEKPAAATGAAMAAEVRVVVKVAG